MPSAMKMNMKLCAKASATMPPLAARGDSSDPTPAYCLQNNWGLQGITMPPALALEYSADTPARYCFPLCATGATWGKVVPALQLSRPGWAIVLVTTMMCSLGAVGAFLRFQDVNYATAVSDMSYRLCQDSKAVANGRSCRAEASRQLIMLWILAYERSWRPQHSVSRCFGLFLGYWPQLLSLLSDFFTWPPAHLRESPQIIEEACSTNRSARLAAGSVRPLLLSQPPDQNT